MKLFFSLGILDSHMWAMEPEIKQTYSWYFCLHNFSLASSYKPCSSMHGTKQRSPRQPQGYISHLWIGKLKSQEQNISKRGFWMTGKGQVGKRKGGTVLLTDLQCQWTIFSTIRMSFGWRPELNFLRLKLGHSSISPCCSKERFLSSFIATSCLTMDAPEDSVAGGNPPPFLSPTSTAVTLSPRETSPEAYVPCVPTKRPPNFHKKATPMPLKSFKPIFGAVILFFTAVSLFHSSCLFPP